MMSSAAHINFLLVIHDWSQLVNNANLGKGPSSVHVVVSCKIYCMFDEV